MTREEMISKGDYLAEEAWAAWKLLWQIDSGKVTWTPDDVAYLKAEKKATIKAYHELCRVAYENRPKEMWDGREETRAAYCILVDMILPN